MSGINLARRLKPDPTKERLQKHRKDKPSAQTQTRTLDSLASKRLAWGMSHFMPPHDVAFQTHEGKVNRN